MPAASSVFRCVFTVGAARLSSAASWEGDLGRSSCASKAARLRPSTAARGSVAAPSDASQSRPSPRGEYLTLATFGSAALHPLLGLCLTAGRTERFQHSTGGLRSISVGSED